MLAQLYSELVNLHLEVQKIAAGANGREADAVFDRIVKVENEICATPAESLEDALVKLRLFRVETGAALTDRQRRMLDDAITTLRSATEH
ncbi:MAG: hypothetical protein KIT00_01595 [Rhodospirillales bacterium]|nr:hypothetical protein [Rhodospirillales bacterium]